MGMDWHSSGITTSVLGALKRGLAPIQKELGLYVCGGRGRHSRQTPLEPADGLDPPHLQLPAHHDVRAADVDLRRLHATLAAAAERAPIDFADLLLIPGVGGRTVASLAFVAEVIHGAPSRFADPARFSLAHGGKDGHPFPVPLKVYDETLRVLKSCRHSGEARQQRDSRRASPARRSGKSARAVSYRTELRTPRRGGARSFCRLGRPHGVASGHIRWPEPPLRIQCLLFECRVASQCDRR
jgi:hypothetical protein